MQIKREQLQLGDIFLNFSRHPLLISLQNSEGGGNGNIVLPLQPHSFNFETSSKKLAKTVARVNVKKNQKKKN
jgi:hypothetical protein